MTAARSAEPIAGRATLSAADAAVLVRASRTRIGFFNQARLLFYCAVAAALAAVVSLDGHRKAAMLLLVAAGVLFVAGLVAGSRTQAALGRRYAHGGEREIVVGDDGIEVAEPGMRISYAWARFERALETREHLILFAGASVVALPKRAFAAEDVARVRERVAERVPVQPFA